MELGGADHPEGAVVERDERGVGLRPALGACRSWARSPRARRCRASRPRTDSARSSRRAPPPTNRNTGGVAQLGGGGHHGVEPVADADVARGTSTPGGAAGIGRPGARRRPAGNRATRSQLGTTVQGGRPGPAGVLGGEQLGHGAVEGDHVVEAAERPPGDRPQDAAHRAVVLDLAEALGDVGVAVHAPEHDARAPVEEPVERRATTTTIGGVVITTITSWAGSRSTRTTAPTR